jgi:hypothetical protein
VAIRYTSPHHSEDDPGGLIHDSLSLGEEFTGPAEDVLLAWTLRLDSGIDPAAAARRILAKHEASSTGTSRPEGKQTQRLLELLRQIAATTATTGDRRRGGWRGRARPSSSEN